MFSFEIFVWGVQCFSQIAESLKAHEWLIQIHGFLFVKLRFCFWNLRVTSCLSNCQNLFIWIIIKHARLWHQISATEIWETHYASQKNKISVLKGYFTWTVSQLWRCIFLPEVIETHRISETTKIFTLRLSGFTAKTLKMDSKSSKPTQCLGIDPNSLQYLISILLEYAFYTLQKMLVKYEEQA